VLVALEAARRLGAKRGCVISYANSGDSPVGDRKSVVGYGAVALTASECQGETVVPGPRGSLPVDAPLGPDDKAALLRFARRSIERFLRTETAPLARNLPPALWQRRGAFVTLKIDGELRGCVGITGDRLPLGLVVGTVALGAAFNDRRFPPLSLDEYEHVEIEISLLTPLEKVGGPADIVPGRDGVLMLKGGRSAIFLPQVATEQGWGRDQMLDRLCLKAGLPEGAWRNGAEFFTFRAEILDES
jgi:AmmeMemoRadiSam system protein A